MSESLGEMGDKLRTEAFCNIGIMFIVLKHCSFSIFSY